MGCFWPTGTRRNTPAAPADRLGLGQQRSHRSGVGAHPADTAATGARVAQNVLGAGLHQASPPPLSTAISKLAKSTRSITATWEKPWMPRSGFRTVTERGEEHYGEYRSGEPVDMAGHVRSL